VDVRIRGYERSDLDACRQLWVELTEWHRELFASPAIGGDDPGKRFDEHLSRVGTEHVWVAEGNGRLVGMVAVIPSTGESELELEPIVVARDSRGRGVGEALARVVIDVVRQRGDRFLVTKPVARNDAALRFFHGLGFDVLSQLELLADFRSSAEQTWRSGPSFAGRAFRL
jgi:ribosomal protein S18 acetylase RimI-like enzyme